MAQIFENNKDLEREDEAIRVFCEKYNAIYEKLGRFDIDFKVKIKNTVCFVEVKGRNRKIKDAYPLPISARKIVKLCDKKGEGVIIWACYDGLIYGNIKNIESIGKVGGRKAREGSSNDVEYMLYLDKQDKLIELLKTK